LRPAHAPMVGEPGVLRDDSLRRSLRVWKPSRNVRSSRRGRLKTLRERLRRKVMTTPV
jgi:hypothetical protein